MTKEKLVTLLRNPCQTSDAVDELNRIVDEYPYFHTGHQLYVKGLQITNVEKLESQLTKSALNVRDRGVLYNYLNDIEEIETKVEEVEKISKSPDDLIDSFLKSDAKIVPGSSQYEADLSPSMQDSNDFSTEILADIYATQGYKNKAIENYEQLILKNPEKHIYFAAQIKRLKQ